MEWIKKLTNKILYRLFIKYLSCRIIKSNERINVEYLESIGFKSNGTYFVEENVKVRDKIWVELNDGYYRIFHGERKTFIALESSKYWFDVYYFLMTDGYYNHCEI